MESKKSWQSKKTQWAEYYEENKPEILARNREHRKAYKLIEVDGGACECKVKKCRWSKTYLNNEAPAKSRGEKLKWFLGWCILKMIFGEIYERNLCVVCMGGGAGGTD